MCIKKDEQGTLHICLRMELEAIIDDAELPHCDTVSLVNNQCNNILLVYLEAEAYPSTEGYTVIYRSCTLPFFTFSIASTSCCSSPTNSGYSPRILNLVRCSFIKAGRGEMHNAMELPGSSRKRSNTSGSNAKQTLNRLAIACQK